MGWQDAPIIQPAGGKQPAWAGAPIVQQAAAAAPSESKEPQVGDPVPAGGVPKGFYAVTDDAGKQTLRREVTANDVVQWLHNFPGVGAAEHALAGTANLAGKALSGLSGLVSGGNPNVVHQVQQALHVEPPQTTDPIQQGLETVAQKGAQLARPVDEAVGNLSPAARTAIESAEEAGGDIAGLLGARGAFPERAAETVIARSPTEVAEQAGYTGLRTRADLAATGNKTITNTLIKKDAGMLPEQAPSVAALENARKIGPGKVYDAAEQSLPPKMAQDTELRAGIGNLPQSTSQLPRSPDVEALQEVMLKQPEMTRDELFANIREARERAKAHWKSDDPDKGALGDAYAHLANAYEDFVGRQLEANNAPVSLADWQAARVQMAKNYQAQGALRGEDFDPRVYGKIAERNPHLLTGNAAIVGHVANGLPAGTPPGMVGETMPYVAGAAAGEAVGHTLGGVPGVGAAAGALVAPRVRAALERLRTRGRPASAAQTGSNPALSYFFDQGRMPSGWNRGPWTGFGGYLPSPEMVNAGGGASTPSTLQSLGLTPDVQAAGAQHPAAARLAQFRQQLSRSPMETVDFQGPQNWGPPSMQTELAGPSAQTKVPGEDAIPFENVLEQGGTEEPPVGGVSQAAPRRATKAPKQPSVRTPPGAPTVAEGPPPRASPAQTAFRNKLAADRLRRLAGDLRLEGPGMSEGDPVARLRAALERRDRGFAKGGHTGPGGYLPSYAVGRNPLDNPLADAMARLQGGDDDFETLAMRFLPRSPLASVAPQAGATAVRGF